MTDIGPGGAAATQVADDAPRARSGGNRTVANMVRSLVVVGAVVVVLVLIVPRPSAVSQPPVDVAGIAQGASGDASFPIEVPQGLPTEWKATSAQLLNSTDGIQTWHAGYETSDAQYAAVEEAQDVTTNWVRANSGGGRATGQQVVDGVTWTQLLHQNRLQRTLLLTQGSVTTLVTGTASWTELGQLAASVRPPS